MKDSKDDDECRFREIDVAVTYYPNSNSTNITSNSTILLEMASVGFAGTDSSSAHWMVASLSFLVMAISLTLF